MKEKVARIAVWATGLLLMFASIAWACDALAASMGDTTATGQAQMNAALLLGALFGCLISIALRPLDKHRDARLREEREARVNAQVEEWKRSLNI